MTATIPKHRDFMESIRLMAESRKLKLRPEGTTWIVTGERFKAEWFPERCMLLVNKKRPVRCRDWFEVFAVIDKSKEQHGRT